MSDVPESERRLAEETREVVERDVLPRVADLYESGEFPRDVVTTFGQIGLLGAPLREFGNASPLAWGLACRELERVDSGLRSFVSVQTCLVMEAIERFGSSPQRDEWLPRLSRGDVIGCFALTEPGHGSDPAGLETRASRLPDGSYRLDGHKRWSTNGTLASLAVIWAQTVPEQGAKGIRGFLVPMTAAGLTVRPIDRKLSLRISASSEILLNDCRVPEAAMLPSAAGLGPALSCLNDARYSILWGALGAAEACFDAAREHVGGREQFGRRLAGFQLVQERLADMVDLISSAQLLATRLATLKQSGRLRHQQVSLGKRHNVAAAQTVARHARALLGAEGILVDRAVMRHLCNLETLATYEGTEQIHTLVIGADVTGLSAFR
ncbi:MAG: acyl-CoA dehydrogenase family protein [Chloroflexota bacterium]